jgi:hypothetical protein
MALLTGDDGWPLIRAKHFSREGCYYKVIIVYRMMTAPT